MSGSILFFHFQLISSSFFVVKDSVLKKELYLVCVQSYADYDAAEIYPPNEICIVKFRIEDGIQDIFHEFITLDGDESIFGQGVTRSSSARCFHCKSTVLRI